jgi:hypothetical protein
MGNCLGGGARRLRRYEKRVIHQQILPPFQQEAPRKRGGRSSARGNDGYRRYIKFDARDVITGLAFKLAKR